MKLFYDIDQRRFRQSLTDDREATHFYTKRGDADTVAILPIKNGNIYRFASLTDMVFAVKPAPSDDDPLLLANDFTLNGATGYYESALTQDTAALETLLGASSYDFVDLKAELWIDSELGEVTSRTADFRAYDDVWKGTEGTPLSLETPNEWLTDRAVRFDEEQTLDAGEKTQARSNIGLGTAAVLNTGTTSGTIPLIGAGDKLPTSVIPAVDLVDSVAVANQTARLALSLSTAQSKVVVQTDDGTSWMLIEGGTPATAGDWLQVGDRAITSSDISDATADGAANKGKVLKTDAGGVVKVELLQSVGQVDLTGAGATYHALTSTPTAQTSTDFPPYTGSAQYRPLVKDTNFTAVNGQVYHTTATLTVTDPSPVEGEGFEVLVRNGTATVGGTAYSAVGTVIKRTYHSGAWANQVYDSISSAATLTNKTLDAPTISGIAQFTSTTRPTSAGTGTPAATSLITLDDADERARTATRMVLRDDFVGGTTADGTIGEMGWSKYATGAGGGATPQDAGADNPGVMRITSGDANGNGSTLYLYRKWYPTGSTNWYESWVFSLGQTTDCDLILGGTKDNGSIGIGLFGGQSYGLRYSSARDTDFMFFSKNTNSDFAANDANNYEITSGVAVDSANYHTFEMRSTSLGTVEMRLDGGAWTAVTMTTGSVGHNTFAYIATRAAANKYADIDFFSRSQTITR